MRNPQATKATIIQTSANLFNTKGYKATSLSDITSATGFTKGAIYKHFRNKEDLEQQALRYLNKVMFDTLQLSLKNTENFEQQKKVLFDFFENYLSTAPYDGGCPLMNSACESDDTDPGLRQQSYGMLVNLKLLLKKLLEKAIKNKEIKNLKDVDTTVYLVISSLEGAVMISKLERDSKALQITTTYLNQLLS